MNIIEILGNTAKPELYEKGNAVMWTDRHISKQLLDVHLNPNVDLASRKMNSIKSTVDWLIANTADQGLNILDLGCGPGLYAELLAKKGHKVTGVDFSENSIDYARNEAKRQGLDIAYLNEDYLRLDLDENSFDLVLMIFTDFGVLLPNEREQLLALISKVLKPGGVFIFDVLNDKDIEHKTSPRNWDIARQGFWKNDPYLVLSDAFLYERDKVILYQHVVVDEHEKILNYRFWTHFYSHADLTEILQEHCLTGVEFKEDLIPGDDMWNGEHVTFCKAICHK